MAKALGVPLYDLFGGPVRDKIRLYWPHCGTYRLADAYEVDVAPPDGSLSGAPRGVDRAATQ